MLLIGLSPLFAAEKEAAREKADRAQPPTLQTSVRLEGLTQDDLRKGLQSVGETLDKATFAPRSFGAVRRAARRDAQLFTSYLQSLGYYAAAVEFNIESTAEPYEIVYDFTAGKKFTIDGVLFTYLDDQIAERPTTLQALAIEYDNSPAAPALNTLQSNIRTYFRENGYPHMRIERRRILADFSAGTATVEFTIRSGPLAIFAQTEWRGLDRLKEDYANALIPWKEGEIFNIEELATARQSLSDTNLFSSIDIQPGETHPATGSTPAIVQVTERSPRTIGAGGSYSTNKGPGIRIYWEHRNILSRSEKLRVDLSIAQIEQELRTTLTKPFPRRKSSWTNAFAVGREDSDAFEERRVGLSSSYAKKLNSKLSGRIGVGLEGSELIEDGVNSNIFLASFPTELSRSTVDSTLDPTKGSRISVTATPYAGQADGFAGFTLVELSGVVHQPLTSSRRVIVSSWSRFGATFAGSEGTVPSNKRFYSGGGGSIRGYGYQLAGPVDEDGDPEGGNAVAEFGVEMRGRVYKDVALAAFFEGGSAFESRYPDFSGRLFYGAGAGVRYHTAIGPIRVDFAVPLSRRSGVDDAFQFYISLGQAF